MRRLKLVLVALAIPMMDLAAQRVGVVIPTGGPRPERPAEKPKQAPGIHDARLYNRYRFSRFSFEQSPMLAYMQTTGFVAEGIPESFLAFGDATMISFRAAPSLFLTTAFTASSIGAPFGMNSSDVGIRIKPWVAPRVSVFADASLSFAFTSDFGMPASGVPFAAAYMNAYTDFSTSRGHGGLLGLGTEVRVSSRYSITASLSHTRYDMRGNRLTTSDAWTYTNRMTRLMIGARYNHGSWLDAP